MLFAFAENWEAEKSTFVLLYFKREVNTIKTNYKKVFATLFYDNWIIQFNCWIS